MRRETVLKIVKLLRKELNGGFTILGISKKLKIGYRPAYNHISSLQKEGAITIKTVGRAKQCSLNLENAKSRYFLQESDLMMKESLYKANPKLKSVLEGLISKITRQFVADVHSIVLFGSYAKGTATKNSDVDILFIVSDLKNKALREVIERECASYRYSHNLTASPLITDIIEFKKMLKSKEMNVGKETKEYGISLYGSEQFWRFVAWQE
ncbi:MAG: nucleotidyltransferase domain-containing protein [Nanoarchaeota archaeon]